MISLRACWSVLCGCLITAISSAIGGAAAAEPSLSSPKASRVVLERMATQVSQDVIVVFDDAPTLPVAKSLPLGSGSLLSQTEEIDFRAQRFQLQKDEVIVQLGAAQVVVLKEYSHLPISFIRVQSQEALARLIAHPGVVGVFENRIDRLFLAESLPLIQQPQVAVQGYTGSGVGVAVLDSGVDYTKTAFGPCASPGVGVNCRVVIAQDFTISDGQLDSNGHGTNVAGIVAGVAPGAKILSLRVCDAKGSCPTSATINAINFAIQNKVAYNIVAMNLSLGSGQFFAPTTNDPYFAAFTNARAAGILPVVASGNDTFTNSIASPGAVVGALSVGAVYDSALGTRSWRVGCTDSVTSTDKVTCFSNSASFLTMLAPGSEILAAGILESGTSQATPHVAGAVAVLRAAFPNESLDAITARLTNGDPVTDLRNDITKPRLNLAKAMAIQAACIYSLSANTITAGSGGTVGSITVSAAPGCSWQASSGAAWINVTGGTNGTSNGTVSYSIAANANISARTGILTVAGIGVVVNQAGSTASTTNILQNGDFETGSIAWNQSTANGLPIITNYITPAASNRGYAWFCGYDNCVDQLYQDITIPGDAQSVSLQFSYLIDTQEQAAASVYDTLTVQVFSPPTAVNPALTCNVYSNLNASMSWAVSAPCNLFGLRGQQIRIRFLGNTDPTLLTNFYVDDISLNVSGSALTDTQAPSVPTGLVAAVISSSQVSLSWLAATDNVAVANHKVYSNGVLLGSTNSSSPGATITSLASSTTYSFKVAACDAVGNCSLPSAAVLVSTPQFVDTQAPTVPTGLSAIPISISSISLSWLAASDNVSVVNYRVFRDGVLVTTLGNVTNYLDSGLRANTTHTYAVSACDAASNCSAQSLPVVATTLALQTASTPVVFSGTSTYQTSGSSVNITITSIRNNSFTRTSGSLRLDLWALNIPYDYVSGSSGYKTASIRTSAITGLADQMLPNVSFNNINLNLFYTAPPAGFPNYTLFLLEYNPANCAAADGFCVIDYMNYHENQAPSIPGALTAVATGMSTINLAWQPAADNVGVTNYNVYRGGVWIAALGNVTTYADAGLLPATTYSYSVSACDAVGNCSATSFPANATTLSQSNTAPTVPTGLAATIISGSQVNLTWNPSTDAVGVTAYRIYSSGALVGTLGNVTSSLRNTVAGSTYSYTVAACNFAGLCSAQSAAVIVNTPALSAQTITFGALASRIFGTAPFGIAASASSGLQVSFGTTTPAICSVIGTTVSVLAAGTCSIVASQPGSASFAAAATVTQSFTVGRANQTVTFGALANRLISQGTFTLAATATSGNPVVFTSLTPSTCSTGGGNGATVSLLAQGTCTIGATQGGDANYFAANQVNQSFLISAAAPGAPIIGVAIPGNGQAWIAFGRPNSDGGSPITNYTVTCGNVVASGFSSPVVVAPLANGVAVTCVVTAVNATGPGPVSASVSVIPSAAPPLALVAVQSRKVHVGVGQFDLRVNDLVNINGPITVEPRMITNGHSIVFQFNMPIAQSGIAQAFDIATNPIGTASTAASNNEVVVTLNGIPDGRRISIQLTGVNSFFSTQAAIGFLVGDVNGSRSVSASDVMGIKSRSGQPVTTANFQFDLNTSGTLNSNDVSAVKARAGWVIQ